MEFRQRIMEIFIIWFFALCAAVSGIWVIKVVILDWGYQRECACENTRKN